MLTLQRAFKYDGDPAQVPCQSVMIQPLTATTYQLAVPVDAMTGSDAAEVQRFWTYLAQHLESATPSPTAPTRPPGSALGDLTYRFELVAIAQVVGRQPGLGELCRDPTIAALVELLAQPAGLADPYDQYDASKLDPGVKYASGPKDLLENKIFKLSPSASPANASVD
jgi:hypothetical protein